MIKIDFKCQPPFFIKKITQPVIVLGYTDWNAEYTLVPADMIMRMNTGKYVIGIESGLIYRKV